MKIKITLRIELSVLFQSNTVLVLNTVSVFFLSINLFFQKMSFLIDKQFENYSFNLLISFEKIVRFHFTFRSLHCVNSTL